VRAETLLHAVLRARWPTILAKPSLDDGYSIFPEGEQQLHLLLHDSVGLFTLDPLHLFATKTTPTNSMVPSARVCLLKLSPTSKD